jgi:hypothetical protein
MARTLDRAISTPFMEAMAASNIVLNGGMEISQEFGSTQTTLVNNTVKYTVDMWKAIYNHTAATAVFKFQQLAPANSPSFGLGFPMSLQLIATTALSAPAAGDYAIIEQLIEGYRVAKLGFGSATNPQFVTIGFWVCATIAGTMAVALSNGANNRTYPVNVVINNANTWEYKTVTIPVDTSGTWLTTTGIGAYLSFCFCAGSTNQGAAGSWNADGKLGTASVTNFFATANNTVNITGVGMWPGTDAPTPTRSPFAQRPFEEELLKCLRYFYITPLQDNQLNIYGPNAVATADGLEEFQFKVPMRVAPTGTLAGTWTLSNCGAPSMRFTTVMTARIGVAVTAAGAYSAAPQSNSQLKCDARL